MKAHPYADLFPMMSPAERDALRESVRESGLLQPIVVMGGQILDGRNRYSVCVELGIEPWTVEFTGTDPLRHVLALNASRRQMNETQRAMVAARLANMKSGDPDSQRHGGQICPPSVSLEDAAKMLGVSRRSAVSARKIINETAPEVVAACDAGTLKLNAALKKLQAKPQTEVDADNSRAIQQMALDAGLSWAHKGDAISKAVREATGEKLLRKVDTSDPATRGRVEKVLADLSGRSLDEQYQAHRSDVTTLAETAKQKLDRLVARELELRNAMLDREVQEAARARAPDEAEAMRAAKARADAEFKKYAAMRKGIKAQMTEDEYRFLLNVLHPDRAPADRREKFARAFDIVRKLDSYIEATRA